jgi:hypothetical protein
MAGTANSELHAAGTMPSHNSGRKPKTGRVYSGVKRAPWSIRAQCPHKLLAPGTPHRLLTDVRRDGEVFRALVCEACAQKSMRAWEMEELA